MVMPEPTPSPPHQQQHHHKSFRRESNGGGMKNHAGDVTILVGRSRVPYTLTVESLRGSTYFSNLIEKRALEGTNPWSPIAVDCDESVFQQMLTILRYNSFEALPKMSDPEMFRLKRELTLYGIEVFKPSSSPPHPHQSPSHHHHAQTITSSSIGSSPTRQFSEQVDLVDLPEELRVSNKVVLVSRVGKVEDDKHRCACTPKDQHTCWALSFHYRHAFCTSCGSPPSPSTPSRFIAEMYMAAAMYYSGEHKALQTKWNVGCDSTCSLKLFQGRQGCACKCGKGMQYAVSTFHSHAFCTSCGVSADDQTLVSILLSVRYGGVHHRSPRGRKDDGLETGRSVDSGRETPRLHPAPLPKIHAVAG